MLKYQFWVVETEEFIERDRSFIHCSSRVTISFRGVCYDKTENDDRITFKGYASFIESSDPDGKYEKYLTYIPKYSNGCCFVPTEGYTLGFVVPAGSYQ